MFWSASHRKILAILDVDKDVNNPDKKAGNKQKSGQKIGLKEALKQF